MQVSKDQDPSIEVDGQRICPFPSPGRLATSSTVTPYSSARARVRSRASGGPIATDNGQALRCQEDPVVASPAGQVQDRPGQGPLQKDTAVFREEFCRVQGGFGERFTCGRAFAERCSRQTQVLTWQPSWPGRDGVYALGQALLPPTAAETFASGAYRSTSWARNLAGPA